LELFTLDLVVKTDLPAVFLRVGAADLKDGAVFALRDREFERFVALERVRMAVRIRDELDCDRTARLVVEPNEVPSLATDLHIAERVAEGSRRPGDLDDDGVRQGRRGSCGNAAGLSRFSSRSCLLAPGRGPRH